VNFRREMKTTKASEISRNEKYISFTGMGEKR
jgi:hypothetical protein